MTGKADVPNALVNNFPPLPSYGVYTYDHARDKVYQHSVGLEHSKRCGVVKFKGMGDAPDTTPDPTPDPTPNPTPNPPPPA